MLADIVLKGSSDRSVRIRFIEASGGSNPGDPISVDHSTTGLALWYRREGGTKTAVSPAALSALDDAHSDGGIEPISDGWSRVDLPDAAFAVGAEYVEFGGSATDVIGIGGVVRLTSVNLDDSVRGGMAALPNAEADSAGGLPVSDAGGLDLDAALGAFASGTVTNASPTTTTFEDSTKTASNFSGSVVAFYSGSLKGVARRVASGSGTTFTLAPALPAAPSQSDKYVIIGRIDA